MLLVKYSDFPDEPFSVAQAQESLVDANESLTAWWEANSYGRQTLDLEIFPLWMQLGVPIAGYCRNQNPDGSWVGCNTTAMLRDTLAVLDPFYDFTGFERLIVAFNGLGFPGLAIHAETEEGDIPAAAIGAQFALAEDGRSTVAHEIGHLAGLPHAQAVDCPDSIFPPDPFVPTSGGCLVNAANRLERSIDPMGASGGFFQDHFSAFYKERLGFIGANRIDVIPATSTAIEVRLYSIQDDIDGRQMVRIPTTTPPARGAWYFAEYRPLSGNDPVILRLKPGNGAQSFYGTRLGPGDTFLDPIQGIRIVALSAGSDAKGDYIDLRIDKP
jgi:hypothetical protein